MHRITKFIGILQVYVSEMHQSLKVILWAWKEFTTDESRKRAKRMVWSLLVLTGAMMVQPWVVAHIFNGLLESNRAVLVSAFAGLLVCMLIVRAADYYHSVEREWILGLNHIRADFRISELFFEKSLGQHISESTDLSVATIDKGRERALNLQGTLLFEGLPLVAELVLSVVLLWIISPYAGLMMSVVLMVHIIWSLYLNQRVVEVCTPIDKDFRKINRHRHERWELVERVITSARQKDELYHLEGTLSEIMSRDRAFWIWFSRQAMFREVVNSLALLGILALGVWLVWSGQWRLGLLYPLYSWSSRLSQNVWRLGHVERQINYNMPAIRSMKKALSIEPEVKPPESPLILSSNQPLRLEFQGVSQTFVDNGGKASEVLRNVEFVVEPGEKVALLGPSGAGKSTILKLLLRFMDPTRGRILVGEEDLRNLDLQSFLEHVGYIAQHPQVFDGTVLYNLLYGVRRDHGLEEDEIWKTLRLLAADFGSRLYDGLQTVVGRRGMKLSGGQAQRLMIAAAVMKNPGILLVDEATSHLDSATEASVQEGLEKALSGGVSALVIAHRLSTVRKMDKFVVLRELSDIPEGGSQVEAVANSFEELERISPTFRKMASGQFLQAA